MEACWVLDNRAEFIECRDIDIFLRGASSEPGSTSESFAEDDTEEKHERILLCKQCDTEITKSKLRSSRSGKHLHTFFNPAGIVYEIGCFNEAPGCILDGPGSTEFSWFGGYTWQIAFCGMCREHLGWYYSSGDDSFFGLIVNRLREG